MEICFDVPGEPSGKGRPRFARCGDYTKTYTPEKTANYEALVKMCCREKSKGMLEGPLRVSIKAFFHIPQSTSIKKYRQMLNHEIRPTKKPDADNVAKIICDAVNGIAYHDDKQIVSMQVEKFYGAIPKVCVCITEL